MIKEKFIPHIVLVGLLILSFVLFGRVIPGEFIYDDLLFNNRLELRKLEHLPNIWLESFTPYNDTVGTYRPLTVTTFSLNYILFGNSSAGFHIVNILIHGGVAFLVFMISRRLFKSITLAVISSILFMFLPIHMDAINLIKSRDDLLSAFFALLSWLVFLKSTSEKKVNYKGIALSAFIFYLGLLSREMVLFAPLIFLITFYLTKKPAVEELAKIGLIFFVFSLPYLFLRMTALGPVAFTGDDPYFIFDPLRNAEFMTKFWTGFKLLTLYIQKTVLPFNLSSTYTYNQIPVVSNPIQSWEVILGIFILGAMIVLTVHRKTRATPIGIGLITFLISYIIFSKFFVQLSEIMAERYMYFPSVGLCMVGAFLIYKLIEKNKYAGWGIFAVILVIFFSVILSRNDQWLDKRQFYEGMISDAPNAILGHQGMAGYYFSRGELDKAREFSDKGMAIYPDYPPLLKIVTLIAFTQGDIDTADKAITKAVELAPGVLDHRILNALILSKKGKYKESLNEISIIIRKNPMREYRPEIRQIIAINLYKLGMVEEAKKYFDWDKSKTEEEKIKIIEDF